MLTHNCTHRTSQLYASESELAFWSHDKVMKIWTRWHPRYKTVLFQSATSGHHFNMNYLQSPCHQMLHEQLSFCKLLLQESAYEMICNTSNNLKYSRNTAYVVVWHHCLACAGEAACRPAVVCYRPWQTPATVSSLVPYTMSRLASNKKLSNCRWTAWCSVSVEILSTAFEIVCNRRMSLQVNQGHWITSC